MEYSESTQRFRAITYTSVTNCPSERDLPVAGIHFIVNKICGYIFLGSTNIHCIKAGCPETWTVKLR